MGPKIRKTEFSERLKKVRQLMDEQNLDLILLYADDRYVYGQAFARWIVDYQPQFESALILVPFEGEVAIATGAESVEFALCTSKCRRVYASEEFLHPDEDYPYCETTTLKKIISSMEECMGKPVKNIGVAGREFIPYDLFKKILEEFGEGYVFDVGNDLTMLRAVKSADEISVIKYAYQIAARGMETVYDNLKEGISERELAAEAEYEMRKMGSEGMGIELMLNSGPINTAPILSRTTFRKIKQGDLIVATLAPRYEGYHGAIGRPFVLGEPSDEIRKCVELVMYAQEETARRLAPGMTAVEMDKISRGFIEAAGYGTSFAYSAIHSVGVIEFEAPILSSKTELVLQPGMVFSIDIPLFLNDWGGMRLENGYLVTENGCERLNPWSKTYVK